MVKTEDAGGGVDASGVGGEHRAEGRRKVRQALKEKRSCVSPQQGNRGAFACSGRGAGSPSRSSSTSAPSCAATLNLMLLPAPRPYSAPLRCHSPQAQGRKPAQRVGLNRASPPPATAGLGWRAHGEAYPASRAEASLQLA